METFNFEVSIVSRQRSHLKTEIGLIESYYITISTIDMHKELKHVKDTHKTDVKACNYGPQRWMVLNQ